MNGIDYISSLPDDIISNILSRLEIRCAVRTCVLSKAWENKWITIQYIVIENDSFEPYGNFVNLVDIVLIRARNVKNFNFMINSYEQPEYETICIETWLYTIFGCSNIEKVAFDCIHNIKLPRSLSTCTSLRKLWLIMPCVWNVPDNNYFPNLTKLHLWYVSIENSNSDTLIFRCPVLKDFVIGEHDWSNVRSVELYAPALISFFSHNQDGEEDQNYPRGVKIIGACLEYFETGGFLRDNFLLTESTLSHATLGNYDNKDNAFVKSGLPVRRLLRELSSLKSLELTIYLAQVLAATKSELPLFRFNKLEKLALFTDEGMWLWDDIEGTIEGLFVLLRLAPILKSLSIAFERFYVDFRDEEGYEIMEPTPSCVASHLEEVKIGHFSGYKHQLHLTKYFMENGAQLKNLSLTCKPGIEKDDIINQLIKFPKASTSLEIIFTEE